MEGVLYPRDLDFMARATAEARACIEMTRGQCSDEDEARIARAIFEAFRDGERRYQLIVACGVLAVGETSTRRM
jgi:hypothetical protein